VINLNKGVLELSHGNSRARASKFISSTLGVKLGGSRLDRVNLETALYKKTSICFRIVDLDPLLKIRKCGMLKFTTTHKFHVYWF